MTFLVASSSGNTNSNDHNYDTPGQKQFYNSRVISAEMWQCPLTTGVDSKIAKALGYTVR